MKKKNSPPKASTQAESVPETTLSPDTVAYWFVQARQSLANDDMEGAINAYQHATRIDPDCEFWVAMGERCLYDGSVERALQAYEQANKLDPSNAFRASYWDWLGTTREAMGDPNGAMDAFGKWAQAAPDSIEPVDRIGTLMVQQEMWTDLPVLRNMYVERSRYKSGSNDYKPEVLESMALYAYFLEQELGNKEDPSAQELAYATLRGKYDSISMRYLLGCLYYDLERYDSAETEFRRALKLLKKNPEWCERRFDLKWTGRTALYMLGCIARKMHNPEGAIEAFEACLAPNENGEGGFSASELRVTRALISLLMEQGMLEEAEEKLCTLCQAVDSLMARFLPDMEGKVLDINELFANISSEAIAAIALDQASEWRHVQLLELSLRQGDFETAEIELEHILLDAHDEDPDDEDEGDDEDDEDEDFFERKGSSGRKETKALRTKITEANRSLAAAEKNLKAGKGKEACLELLKYCQHMPEDMEQRLRLGRLLLEQEPEPPIFSDFDELMQLQPQSLELLEIAEEFYGKHNNAQRQRLIQLSLAAQRALQHRHTINEWFSPAAPHNPALLMGVSARVFPGTGQLILTGGDDTVADQLRVAYSLLRAEAEGLRLLDLDKLDIHVRLRTLGNKPVSLAAFNQLQGNDEAQLARHEALKSCDNNLGLVLFLAIYGAVVHEFPERLTLVGGAIDLYGNIGMESGLAECLEAVSNYEGQCWERLILPQLLAPELLSNAITVWGEADEVVFGTNVIDLISAMRKKE